MDWEQLRIRLESILNVSVQLIKMHQDEWKKIGAGQTDPQQPHRAVANVGMLYVPMYREGDFFFVMAAEAVGLPAAERRLIETVVEVFVTKEKLSGASAGSSEEHQALELTKWIAQKFETGQLHSEVPEPYASLFMLHNAKIPMMLYGDYPGDRRVSYVGLKKLLESFFGEKIVLLPLKDKEWLILGPESLLADSGMGERENGENETLEESLSSICSGLYEMMASEWVGECHLSVHYPVTPAKSLLSTVSMLREAIVVGKAFHVSTNIHLPWMLRLETLLYAVSGDVRMKFTEQVLRQIDRVLDSETLLTLEEFFELDCNVSETAKKLYIHRNTLLYRLDKFKQETGLDVRTFRDAVLVKLALLLYKVTKRK